ncbi:MAG TPA: hypothetical protein VJN18_32565 [Polyangiaceae bacterium]|nr:hypothetical protein [Polyangiaceae bacterium]
MTAVSYDSKEGIARFLSRGLVGLDELRRERRAAGYDRKERLQYFCVSGRWILDSCGNFGTIVEVAFKPGNMTTLGKVPDVMTDKEVELFMRGELFTYSSGWAFPPPDACCPECGKGWNIENATDFEMQRNGAAVTPVFAHKACSRRRIAREERTATEKVFADAGYPRVNLVSTPNQYCPCDSCPPWYLAQVGELPPIRIGWRKRVIVIDWEATGQQLPALFEGEGVTKSATMIHAWGYEKASEYLARLLPALGDSGHVERKAEQQ